MNFWKISHKMSYIYNHNFRYTDAVDPDDITEDLIALASKYNLTQLKVSRNFSKFEIWQLKVCLGELRVTWQSINCCKSAQSFADWYGFSSCKEKFRRCPFSCFAIFQYRKRQPGPYNIKDDFFQGEESNSNGELLDWNLVLN